MIENRDASKERALLDKCSLYPGPDMPIGYIGLSLGPQDPRGPPANCGAHSQLLVYDQFNKYSPKFMS